MWEQPRTSTQKTLLCWKRHSVMGELKPTRNKNSRVLNARRSSTRRQNARNRLTIGLRKKSTQTRSSLQFSRIKNGIRPVSKVSRVSKPSMKKEHVSFHFQLWDVVSFVALDSVQSHKWRFVTHALCFCYDSNNYTHCCSTTSQMYSLLFCCCCDLVTHVPVSLPCKIVIVMHKCN